MKLEDLISITTIEKNVYVKDCCGRLVGQCTMTEGIPPYLNEVEVDSISVDADGNMWVDVCLENNLPFLDHVKNMLDGVNEDLCDEYRVATVEDVNRRIRAFAAILAEESKLVEKALDEGNVWDYYLG